MSDTERMVLYAGVSYINRRMKGQGMSWSPAGARRLSKLRVLSLEPRGWETFWSRYG